MLHQQALRGQRLLESETGALTGDLRRLQEAQESLEGAEGTGVPTTAGLLGNAARYREFLALRRLSLAEEIAEGQRRLEAQQARLREARQAVAGWELLAERLRAQEKRCLARQEQEIADQHGQWRSRRSG